MDSESRHRSPARLLAPIALVVFGVIVLLVISSGGGGGGSGGGNSANKAAEQRDLGKQANGSSSATKSRHRTKTTTTSGPTSDVYVVKQGDTLAAIAEKTSVSVERLQELNPGLDQFSLVAGQRIKLR